MLMNLMLGCITVFISMGIQVAVVVMMLRYLLRMMHARGDKSRFGFDTYVIGMVLLILFLGHLLQIAIWASLFVYPK